MVKRAASFGTRKFGNKYEPISLECLTWLNVGPIPLKSLFELPTATHFEGHTWLNTEVT